MCEELSDFKWLYRGVPFESPERQDVLANGEVYPPRPERIGEQWALEHQAGFTETGFTSWTTDRSIATDAADSMSDGENLSGRTVVFRVRVNDRLLEKALPGREDESEYLIQGTVEYVSISSSDIEDDEEEDDNAN